MNDDRPSAFELFASLMALPIFVGPIVLGWQIYHWLKTADWEPISVDYVLQTNNIHLKPATWQGVQVIIDHVLAMPFSVFFFLLWAAVIVLLIKLIEENRAARRK